MGGLECWKKKLSKHKCRIILWGLYKVHLSLPNFALWAFYIWESNFWKFWWDESFGASSMYFTKQPILHCEFIELCRCRLRPVSTGWLTVALMLDTERWLWTLGPGATLVWARAHGHHHHQAHHGISEVLQVVSPLLGPSTSTSSTFTFKTLC